MKKNSCFALLISCLLLTGTGVFAKNAPKLSEQVTQKIEQADNRQQIGLFMEQFAQKNPAAVAQLLLGYKFTYVYNESITYIGVKESGEVLVVCRINDSDVGTFYYMVHKNNQKIHETEQAAAPRPQGFATLFERN